MEMSVVTGDTIEKCEYVYKGFVVENNTGIRVWWKRMVAFVVDPSNDHHTEWTCQSVMNGKENIFQSRESNNFFKECKIVKKAERRSRGWRKKEERHEKDGNWPFVVCLLCNRIAQSNLTTHGNQSNE